MSKNLKIDDYHYVGPFRQRLPDILAYSVVGEIYDVCASSDLLRKINLDVIDTHPLRRFICDELRPSMMLVMRLFIIGMLYLPETLRYIAVLVHNVHRLYKERPIEYLT